MQKALDTKLVERAAGRIELQMQVGGALELQSWVLSFGSGARVLEPASLRKAVEAELKRSLRRYRQ